MNSRYISMVESGLKPCSAKMLKKVELLVRTKHLAKPPASVHPEDCPRCAELEVELREARAVIRDLAASLAAVLALKPSTAADHACVVADGAARKQKMA